MHTSNVGARVARGICIVTLATDIYRTNLTAWHAMADPAELDSGRAWYRDAREFVATLSARFPQYSAAQCGAATAALSPNCAWTDNKAAAAIVVASHAAGIPAATLSLAGVYPVNVAKAYRILTGAPIPAVCNGTRIGARGGSVKCNGVSHGCRAPLHGPKVSEFYRTIMGDTNGRTMDVWATRAADVSPADVGTMAPDDPRFDGIPGARLTELQLAYSDVADIVGESPAVLQAIVWVTIRNRWTRRDGARHGSRD